MKARYGSIALGQEVMDQGLCTGCGLCVGMCPYIKSINERVAVIHPCGKEDGNCYKICPKTLTDWVEMDNQVFGGRRQDHILGNYQKILFARTRQAHVHEKGQYGGVATSLLSLAIEKGQVDAAVATGGPAGEIPKPTVAHSREEVLACGGSHYSASPSMGAVNQAVKEGAARVAATGRPCQVLALRKMQALDGDSSHNLAANKVNFIVGLFCFWALDSAIYSFLSKQVGVKGILKVDILVDGIEITTSTGKIKIPVDKVRPYIRSTCQECFDPTSEFADVSVGSTEYDPGWNTLIVRTKKGEEMVDMAVNEGIIETKAYPEERLPMLYTAVRNKKLRVLQQKEQNTARYLQLDDEYKQGIIDQGVRRV
ncbi:Coenzyme F420 hydrogenase/dehydrogenase, beta subunit C-terminal domain [Metallumcola ferriviriculae]|uniref:Coenzyme F420 hydrogenase/dehydrogenase, beta subunit C-terminal domain n=1 Tax=Metallumcola ferriviriculae TaxID=3039180 RepID=A0AAU0UM31_9FIRM|nr:Coenzyme F420 hydrogenase/dehydrogenase, beta subunit C-terminal domain [Desulfitibacteraceae bacterium MK1]